jgi:hypothetical protein
MDAALLASVLLKAMEFAQVMAKAKAEGREVSAEEIEAFRDGLLDSDTELESAIAKARSEGR